MRTSPPLQATLVNRRPPAKRRSLVLTDESAGNRFLASLPPHVRQTRRPVPARMPWRLSADELRGFLLAYCACLLAVSLYIA